MLWLLTDSWLIAWRFEPEWWRFTALDKLETNEHQHFLGSYRSQKDYWHIHGGLHRWFLISGNLHPVFGSNVWVICFSARKLTFNVVVDRTCAFILSEVTLMRPFLSLGSDKRLLEVRGPLVLDDAKYSKTLSNDLDFMRAWSDRLIRNVWN